MRNGTLEARTMFTAAALAGAVFAASQLAAPSAASAQTDGETEAAGPGEAPSIALQVSGMQCEGCKRRLKAGLSELEGVIHVAVNLEAGEVAVWANAPNEVEDAELKSVATERGFSVEGIFRGEKAAQKLAGAFPEIGG